MKPVKAMPEGACAPDRRRRLAAILLLACLSGSTLAQGAGATLEPLDFESNEGYYQLTWQADEPVRLVESSSPDFRAARALYSGTATGHVVSGRPDGTWHYRLESADGARVLSDAATITVRHHSLGRAFAFFGLGAVVFVATLGLIFLVRPHDDERA
jgi:hypothetical protein